jgi:hypothetical protein
VNPIYTDLALDAAHAEDAWPTLDADSPYRRLLALPDVVKASDAVFLTARHVRAVYAAVVEGRDVEEAVTDGVRDPKVRDRRAREALVWLRDAGLVVWSRSAGKWRAT